MVTAVLCVAAVIEFVTVSGESQTYDESNQLLSGYVYLTTGRFTVALEQPPLAKLLWAVPVAFLNPSPPPQVAPADDPWPAGRWFLYHNRVPADTMLMAGRSCAIGLSLLLGLAIAFWARRYFGAAAAITAVFIYAADPNFLANGRYMKNDVAAVLTIFVAVMIWGSYLAHPRSALLWICGVALGVALATKSSALVLLPVMLILYGIREWQQRRPFSILICARRFAIVGLAASLIVFAVYAFEIKPLGESGIFRRLFPNATRTARIPVPALSYFSGLSGLGQKQSEGGLATGYVLGEPARFGRWYTSFVAIAVKTPLAELALFTLAAAIAIKRLRRVSLRDIDFKWFLFLIPPVIYLASTLPVHFNAGLRHLLPLYPFLFVFAIGLILSRPVAKWRMVAVITAAAILMLETASVHPHYLAFFNAFAGGPTGGRRFLVDSNLDWGQDVKYLKTYLDAHGIEKVSISYFGMADLAYYGIRSMDLPDVPDFRAVQKLDCVAAISVTNLALKPRRYAGLEALQPMARIGYSIYVYDIRRRRPEGGK
jgi:uncharacterized membrane protein YhaH (DUF805 family)